MRSSSTCEHATRYDATRGRTLDGYLEHNARRNVLNALDSARRRLAHETMAVPPNFWETLAASTPEQPSALVERFFEMLATVRASLTPEEQIVHDLRMAKADTAAYARAIHLEHLPWPEQVHRVRRFQDAVSHTVRRRLLRLRDQLYPPSNG